LSKRAVLTGGGVAMAWWQGAVTCSATAGASALATTPLFVSSGVLMGCVVVSLCGAWGAKSRPVQAALGLSMGVLLAPAFGCSATVTAPLAAAMLALGAALQVGLSAKSYGLWEPSWSALAPTVAASACLGVMACDVALGVGGVTLGVHIGMATLAYWAMAAAVISIVSRAPMFLPQSYLKSFRVDDAVVNTMRLEGMRPQPTILQPPEALCQSLRRLQHMDHGQQGLPIYALAGSAATGKTVMSQGIAQALGADLFLATANRLRSADIPAVPIELINLVALIGQADMHAQITKRPTVLVVDEADTLLCVPKNAGGLPSPLHVLGLRLVSEILILLAMIPNRVSLVFVTNHIEPLRRGLQKVDAKMIDVAKPDSAARLRIAQAQLRSLQDAYIKRGFAIDLMQGSDYAVWCDIVAQQDWQGRDIAACVACIERSLDAARFDSGPQFEPIAAATDAMRAGCAFLRGHVPAFVPAVTVPADDTDPALAYAEQQALGVSYRGSLAQVATELMQGLMALQLSPAKQAMLNLSYDRMSNSYSYLVGRFCFR
jgi:hypothetical protein